MDLLTSMIPWSSSQAASATQPSTVLIVTTTAVATLSFVAFARYVLWPAKLKILPSPLHNVIPRLKKEELNRLAYRPDSFPGARDVETPVSINFSYRCYYHCSEEKKRVFRSEAPSFLAKTDTTTNIFFLLFFFKYGSIRVYEFGPEEGEKILFVHGISTSCITLKRIADALAQRGHRVMLFDLFGRGFTDGVGDLPHDDRLYVSQILHVLASSPLPWTGARAFHLIGYSLGGGIAVSFSRYQSHMLKTLVLLAPSGLIRPESFGTVTPFLFSSGIVPDRLLAVLTGRRLQRPIASSRKAEKTSVPVPAAEAAIAGKVDSQPAVKESPWDLDVPYYVRWMVINHAGFVPAFISCIVHAPLKMQHESWAHIRKRKPGTTAIIFASDDEIIDWQDYERQGLPLVGGRDRVRWSLLPGGHDFVMTHASAIVHELDDFWEGKN